MSDSDDSDNSTPNEDLLRRLRQQQQRNESSTPAPASASAPSTSDSKSVSVSSSTTMFAVPNWNMYPSDNEDDSSAETLTQKAAAYSRRLEHVSDATQKRPATTESAGGIAKRAKTTDAKSGQRLVKGSKGFKGSKGSKGPIAKKSRKSARRARNDEGISAGSDSDEDEDDEDENEDEIEGTDNDSEVDSWNDGDEEFDAANARDDEEEGEDEEEEDGEEDEDEDDEVPDSFPQRPVAPVAPVTPVAPVAPVVSTSLASTSEFVAPVAPVVSTSLASTSEQPPPKPLDPSETGLKDALRAACDTANRQTVMVHTLQSEKETLSDRIRNLETSLRRLEDENSTLRRTSRGGHSMDVHTVWPIFRDTAVALDEGLDRVEELQRSLSRVRERLHTSIRGMLESDTAS